MVHVLFITSYAPSLIHFRGKLIEEMIKKGHQVSAISTYASENIREEFKSLGVNYLDIPIDKRGMNPFSDLIYFFKLLRGIKSVKPDIVISYTIKSVIYGSITASFLKTPFIISMITGLGYTYSNETLFRRVLKKITIILYRFAIKRNNLVFFQNPDDLAVFHQNKILRNNTKSVLINGSGVDINQFTPKPFPENISFLMIARLLKEKGVREYLQAAEIIKKKHPGIHFVLVGVTRKGPSFIPKEELNSKLQAGAIEYLGVLKDVRPAIAKCSVYVLPSYAEGTPRTVLEAMAMGRPIITSDAPGCRETVTDGKNGYLIPPKNVPELVAAMERFICNPGMLKEFGRASREMAVQKYDVDKVNDVILCNLDI